jgi:hypothetical protein
VTHCGTNDAKSVLNLLLCFVLSSMSGAAKTITSRMLSGSIHSVLDVPQQNEIQHSDIRQTRWPMDWSVAPNPINQEDFLEGFSNVPTPVWDSTIPLVEDVRLKIRCLGVHEQLQRVKVNATRYCGFHERKLPNNPVHATPDFHFTATSNHLSADVRIFRAPYVCAVLSFPDWWETAPSENKMLGRKPGCILIGCSMSTVKSCRFGLSPALVLG